MFKTRGWLELPMDLVSVITKKLGDLPDFTRFRAVCKTWGATPLSACPPQLPWLLEWQGDERCVPVLEREQRFYSLSSGETGTIRVEESHWEKEYRGHCQGYILLLHEQGGLSLFNPLTKEEIFLPAIYVNYHWSGWTSANRTGNEVGVGDQNLSDPVEKGIWVYHHPDNKGWISVGFFNNCCYWNGMFFSTQGSEDTNVFHASKKLLHKIPPPEGEIVSPGSQVSVNAYLVESTKGIFRVSWHIEWFDHIHMIGESVFHIYRLNFHGVKGHPCWVEVSSIGDQMVFLDELNGFSISAKPFAGFQSNCIYFIHPWLRKPHKYDIKADTVEPMPCPFEDCTWFLPSLQ